MAIKSYRVTGIVQGVGFRPFIHRIAVENDLCGWVLNDSKGVLIEVQGTNNNINKFVGEVKTKKPVISKIEHLIEINTDTEDGTYNSFEIRESVQLEETNTLISPDYCVCEDCIKEMFDPNNRRYRYPFINCTNCGPRYTIIEEMPYDRPKTTMKEFEMCPECLEEYTNVRDRRYHAQPNACPKCGPKLSVLDASGKEIQCNDEVYYIIEKLKAGKIVAIKSLGGFHLSVNAKDDEAIKRLRKLKKRDSKPFALMMPNIDIVKKYMYVDDEEEKLLKSEKRPIVILKKKEDTLLPLSIAPNNPSFGVMLPSAPLHYLLLEDNDLNVLVMTSGNISGEPIVFKNNDAFNKLNKIADYFLMNNRKIYLRVDDSIVKSISDGSGKFNTIVRRARGYAPYPITVNKRTHQIFAFGSELKNTISLSKGNKVYLSQHIGDVKNDEIFESLLLCKKHLEDVLDIAPEYYVCDMHPSFRSTRYALEQKEKEVIRVQHHHAHMVSCMAENNLDNKYVLGIIFDGTGYGIDNTIWGGEFLLGNYSEFKRVASIKTCKLLGGDRAVKEPKRVAYNILLEVFGNEADNLDIPLIKYLSDVEKQVYSKMSENNINAFETSSMGRLFDGISALLGICYEIEYEGQAAIELEAVLDRQFDMLDPYDYRIEKDDEKFTIDYSKMVKQIVEDIQRNISIPVISRRFHSTIIEMSKDVAILVREKYEINTIVISGGVFMNEFLLSNMIKKLSSENFEVYHQEKVPTNDGGLSLGQLMIAEYIIEGKSNDNGKKSI